MEKNIVYTHNWLLQFIPDSLQSGLNLQPVTVPPYCRFQIKSARLTAALRTFLEDCQILLIRHCYLHCLRLALETMNADSAYPALTYHHVSMETGIDLHQPPLMTWQSHGFFSLTLTLVFHLSPLSSLSLGWTNVSVINFFFLDSSWWLEFSIFQEALLDLKRSYHCEPVRGGSG